MGGSGGGAGPHPNTAPAKILFDGPGGPPRGTPRHGCVSGPHLWAESQVQRFHRPAARTERVQQFRANVLESSNYRGFRCSCRLDPSDAEGGGVSGCRRRRVSGDGRPARDSPFASSGAGFGASLRDRERRGWRYSLQGAPGAHRRAGVYRLRFGGRSGDLITPFSARTWPQEARSATEVPGHDPMSTRDKAQDLGLAVLPFLPDVRRPAGILRSLSLVRGDTVEENSHELQDGIRHLAAREAYGFHPWPPDRVRDARPVAGREHRSTSRVGFRRRRNSSRHPNATDHFADWRKAAPHRLARCPTDPTHSTLGEHASFLTRIPSIRSRVLSPQSTSVRPSTPWTSAARRAIVPSS